MLIPFLKLFDKYNLNITGILHVGAHECEEIHDYENKIPRSKILWVEAIPGKVTYCTNSFENLLIENAVVSDKQDDVVTFHVTNNGQSSSLLELGEHKLYYPHIYFVYEFEAKTKRLDNLLEKYDTVYNFLNMDIQGTELLALKGLGKYLDNFDYIYTEVNTSEIYLGCAKLSDIDDFLQKHNFKRAELSLTDANWGDAFYIKI